MKKTEIMINFCLIGPGSWIEDLNDQIGSFPNVSIEQEPAGAEDSAFPSDPEYSWECSTGYIQEWDFEVVLDKFIALFGNGMSALPALIEQHGLYSRFTVVAMIEFSDETPAFFFSKRFLDLAHGLNAEIELDLYYSFPSGTFPPKEKILYY